MGEEERLPDLRARRRRGSDGAPAGDERLPRLVGLGGRSAADPWVIALAMVNGWTVVTEEKATRKADKPNIPDVCAGLGVKVMSGADLIEAEGWVI